MKFYKEKLTASINRKGVMDIDTVKGCTMGMKKYPDGGCYGLCYAYKIAKLYRYDFTKSVSRLISDKDIRQLQLFNGLCLDSSKIVFNTVKRHKMSWFRIGVMGDPCHDWPLTVDLCEWLHGFRIPVIVTKHWIKIHDDLLPKLRMAKVVFNTSISPLDSDEEIKHRLQQFNRLKAAGIRSVLRIVSCKFGNTATGTSLNEIQKELFCNSPIIDNPLRIPKTDKRVINGDILVKKHKDLGGGSTISIFNPKTYIGTCDKCPDQCGVI